MSMEIKLRRIDTIYIIDISGEMDLYEAFRLKNVVNKMIERRIRHYIINMQAVQYIDSSGVGALLYVHSELKKRKLNLRITNVHGTAKTVIELTKLINYFPIKPDLSDAIKELRSLIHSAGDKR